MWKLNSCDYYFKSKRLGCKKVKLQNWKCTTSFPIPSGKKIRMPPHLPRETLSKELRQKNNVSWDIINFVSPQDLPTFTLAKQTQNSRRQMKQVFPSVAPPMWVLSRNVLCLTYKSAENFNILLLFFLSLLFYSRCTISSNILKYKESLI